MFRFEFKQTGPVSTQKDAGAIRQAADEALRGLNQKLNAMGATIELRATFDGKKKVQQ